MDPDAADAELKLTFSNLQSWNCKKIKSYTTSLHPPDTLKMFQKALSVMKATIIWNMSVCPHPQSVKFTGQFLWETKKPLNIQSL